METQKKKNIINFLANGNQMKTKKKNKAITAQRKCEKIGTHSMQKQLFNKTLKIYE